MLLKQIIFILVFISAILLLIYNLKRIASYIKLGKPDNRFNDIGKRFARMLKIAFAQTKILREPAAGLLHVTIFWGFIVLLFSASEAVFQGIFGKFSWSYLGPIYTLITLSTDVFCVGIIIAILFSLIRRFVVKVPRLQGDAEEKRDALVVLLSIFTICTSLLLCNSAHSLLEIPSHWSFSIISWQISRFLPISSLSEIYEVCWWLHIVAIFSFMNYLPYSKHFHVFTSVQNVFFSSLTPVNKLKTINFEEEGVEKFGASEINDLTWKTLHDSYTCTHCGRCASVCPANTTGKNLSPRQVMMDIRHRTQDVAPLLLKMQMSPEGTVDSLNDKEKEVFEKKFVGDYENIEALWQCTTCGACMQECPLNIEHVPAIVEMRRSLVMMESNFPAELQPAFANMENNATPWAFSPMERADWAQGLEVKTAADDPDFDVLFWVGCAGSYDDRAIKISKSIVQLLQKAGVNFRILGTEEQCTGDFARRTGNEYLADMLVKANVDTLNRYEVKKIVTACPHCFNTLKNEYPDFGGNYEVIHHSEFLLDLVRQGKLAINKKLNETVTYHDSCYLGRYNEIYDAPRELLKAAGVKIVEAKKHNDRAFCCGAGGGQMFMEETQGKRINVQRTEDLVETGAKTIALNCPFCTTMLTDGVKDKDLVDSVQVKDIAEILIEVV